MEMLKDGLKATRCLRQRYPLSSFCFTLVVDVLSKMMLRVEESSLVEGFLVGRDRIRVSHLQFVDDTIFFSKASKEYEGLGLGLIILRNRALLGKWD